MTLTSDRIKAPATPLATLTDIALSFGGVRALTGVNIGVDEGRITAIIGPNGAGKSSLLNVISGLYRPQAGEIIFAGQRYRHMPIEKLATLGIARTFQNLALFKGMSAIENVMMGCLPNARSTFLEHVFGLPRARREERRAREQAQTIMDALDLRGIAAARVGTLAYGLQKRVEFARALVARPRLLLLDEPMAGLTAAEKREMCRFIIDARDRTGTTIVLIEHDLGVVMELSDRIVVLDYGRKIADGPPALIRDDQAVIDAYIGAQTEALETAGTAS
jgi:branched-chain amino acid transport system ATP-binding protein